MNDIGRFFIGKAVLFTNGEIVMVMDTRGKNDLVIEINNSEWITDIDNMIENMSKDATCYHAFTIMYPEYLI